MILAIYGAGGSGREVYEIARLAGAQNGRWAGFVFIDDSLGGGEVMGLPVHGFEALCARYAPGQLEVTISLGEPAHRQALYNRVKGAGFAMANVIHPGAFLSPTATAGEGLTLKTGSVVSTGCVLGHNVTLQHHVVIGHDARLGDNCQVSSFSDIAGECTVGSQVFFGLNAMVKEKTTIGDWAVVAMGACVFTDVPEAGVVMGNPAKLIKKNSGHRVFGR